MRKRRDLNIRGGPPPGRMVASFPSRPLILMVALRNDVGPALKRLAVRPTILARICSTPPDHVEHCGESRAWAMPPIGSAPPLDPCPGEPN